MNYTQFKTRRMKFTTDLYHRVELELTNINCEGNKLVLDGSAYKCKLVPVNGKFLPRVIHITGTKSDYSFKYDYTTGDVEIPSGEIYGNIKIFASASDDNCDIPIVLEVSKVNSSTYDGVNKYDNESFILLDIYPTRGSSVKVTFDGVTKVINGDISTSQYDSVKKEVFFGTYLGVSDGTTSVSGQLVIEGACEFLSLGTYKSSENKNDSHSCACITNIVNTGAVRYINGGEAFNFDNLVFNRSLDYISPRVVVKESLYGDSTQYFNPIGSGAVFNRNIDKIVADTPKFKGDVYFNNVDWSWWAEGDRQNYAAFGKTFINGEDRSSITDISISKSIKRVGDYSFYGFENLSNITLPDSVESIGNSAFYNCKNISNITLPSSVRDIGSSVFNSDKFTFITIPDSVESIGNSAFYSCKNVNNIYIGKGLMSVGYSALPFRYASTIEVSDSNPNLCVISGCLVEKNTKTLIAGCKNVTVPYDNRIERIGIRAFEYYPFETLEIPNNITYIDDDAFECFTCLKTVTIGKNVSYIGSSAFWQERSADTDTTIETFILLPTTPPAVESSSICGREVATFIVPKGCVDVYKAASRWSNDLSDNVVVEASE